MDDLVKTKVEGLYKSKNALVANDKKLLDAYRNRRKIFRDNSNSKERIDRLEKELGEIKSMLAVLMGKLT